MNRVFINSDNVIEIHVVGNQTVDSVREMGEMTKNFINVLRSKSLPVYVIDNVKRLGETDSRVRQVVNNYAKTLQFDQLALVGDGSATMLFSTNLMLRAIGKSNVRYFSSLDTAMIWFGLQPAE
jgi:hypothetical protein